MVSMMTLAKYGIGSSKQKDSKSARVLSKSLQIRNNAESTLKQSLKAHFKVKSEKRLEILNSISDYYSRIPFDVVIWNKYQTKQCIIDSILLLDYKFNPYRARDAFMHVERMLTNLVHLPWHREFRRIHTYSGLYRLSICDPLIGIEEVFKAAGFRESKECVMHLVLPDDKMPQIDDGESVTGVIFDCMLAQIVLSDIVDVFEKSSKRRDEASTEVSNSWIQAYFRKRSQQTSDNACSSIQGILSNISNNLYRTDNNVIAKASNLDERETAYPVDEISESLRLSDQEKPNCLTMQQSFIDENLLALSDDLLRLPPNLDRIKKVTPAIKYNNHESSSQKSACPTHGSNPQPLLNNGYYQRQSHQQALYDRLPYKPPESCDLVDFHSNPGVSRNNGDSSNHLSDLNESHNDREPLLPRYDRRIIPNTNSTQTKRNLINDTDFDRIHLNRSVGAGHLGSGQRYHSDPPYLNESTSHSQLSSPHPVKSSRYNMSPYKSSSRIHWSCGSCTYNNLISSEICEMCRNKRPSR